MIPREILKKIRQIELRTNRLVTETLGGQYHSVFKGQGMNFEEVREYQPGDEVRAIDWNVTARMNHPFVKKFVEERELTLMLVVDVSGSGLFGSGEQSKRELAAEIASVLAFSAIRNNDKVGLILFTDEVEQYMPPRKGRRHVLRVIREILFFEPKRHGTHINQALEFMQRVTDHRAIVVVISDFLDDTPSGKPPKAGTPTDMSAAETALASRYGAFRQVRRRHDVVAVHIADRYEFELPALGRLVLEDAETGRVVEVNTGRARDRATFKERREKALVDLGRFFRSIGIDSIQLLTGQPYAAALGRFFETREKREGARMTNLASLAALTNDIRGIQPPVRIPGEWDWLWWLLAGVLLLGGIVGFVLWRRRPTPVVLPPSVPPHVRAKQRLAEALLLISDADKFCTAVSNTLRLYLEERFHLHAPERTTEEFLVELQGSAALNPEQKRSLQGFLQSCDLVKFARLEPAESALRDLHDAALRLVDETQFDALRAPPPPPEPPKIVSPPPPPPPPVMTGSTSA